MPEDHAARPERRRAAADRRHEPKPKTQRPKAVRARHHLRPPRIGTTLAATLGTTASLSPGLLPRTAAVQAILTGLLVAAGFALAGLSRIIARRTGFDADRIPVRLRWQAAATGAVVIGGAGVQAHLWQGRLRSAMGVAALSPAHWLGCAVGAVLVAGMLIGFVRGIRWLIGGFGRWRGGALVVAGVVTAQAIALPAVVNGRQSADGSAETAVVQQVSMARSGGSGSAVSWSSLGAEGRKFVAGTPSHAVRVYVGAESAPDTDSRVTLAIRELERSGGLDRSHLVVAVPTGSGWIDSRAADGLDERFGGDVALVALQYSQAPSWVSFVFGRDAAVASTRALFTAVERRIAALDHKPRLYLYGQSLGAAAGSAIFADDTDQERRVCAALWAGPPGGNVHRAGATVLANSSDPVVQWSPELLWRAPDLTGTRPDAPHPPWLPALGFVQTTVDLMTALGPPPGHGHRYGTDQGTAMGTC
ncbi:alpha/beta-hydrolase family protein [Nocardia sp. BMG51109]|uniref:alpha/beta-hydrolase family protein n=1 Tax=Nocardia sp. BMG51109 TaxID=1056816 RepID=UPI000464B22E|nr:alpha/beta-hydrolase family protein [Nocardia sp. BMG51109]